MARPNEPDFIAQTTEPDAAKKTAWIREQAAQARAAGCTWQRVTSAEGDLATVIVEGWKVRPADEGRPRFKKASAKPDA
jgi:hypothetical protein